MRKLLKETSQRVQKMKERMDVFSKANAELSQTLINLYRKIDLNKKVKLPAQTTRTPSPFIESVLHNQSALSVYFDDPETLDKNQIETTDEFKDYPRRNGLISHRQHAENFTPGSEILTMKNNNRIFEGSSFDELNKRYLRKLRSQNR